MIAAVERGHRSCREKDLDKEKKNCSMMENKDKGSFGKIRLHIGCDDYKQFY